MLGLVGRGPETTLVRLGTSHALSDGACLADGCSHLGKGQKTEETSRCVRLRLVGGSAQLTVEHCCAVVGELGMLHVAGVLSGVGGACCLTPFSNISKKEHSLTVMSATPHNSNGMSWNV